MLWRLARLFRNFVFGGPPRFTVRLRDYQAEAIRGKVTRRFLMAVSEIARSDGVRNGLFDGMPDGGMQPKGSRMVEFWFSPGFADTTRQRIRNVYQLEL
ncbi:MAG: hypothetical protein AB7K09_12010 [Planctomycetota bacterium]